MVINLFIKLIRVEKRECVCMEFSQLSFPDQTGTSIIAWELRSESFHETDESFLNSPSPVKREQELHESWWELRRRVCMRVFSTLVTRSNENKNCMRFHESCEAREFACEFSQLSWPGQTKTRIYLFIYYLFNNILWGCLIIKDDFHKGPQNKYCKYITYDKSVK